MTPSPAAVVDTDAFSLLYVSPRQDPRVAGWRNALTGTRVLISFQTRYEVLAGAMRSNWGQPRMAQLQAILDRTPTVRADDTVIVAAAELYARCRAVGHALQDKMHTGDRWVAACALALDLPLLAGDGIYRDAPGLLTLD